MKSQHIDRAFALQAALFQFRRPTDLSEVPGRAQTIDLPQKGVHIYLSTLRKFFFVKNVMYLFQRERSLSLSSSHSQLPGSNEGAVSWLNWNSVKLEATKIEYYVPRFRSQKNLKS